MKRLIAVVAVALGLFLAGCGGSNYGSGGSSSPASSSSSGGSGY